MDWVPDLFSGLSLVAVLVIGAVSVSVSNKARVATERSTRLASQDARLRRIEALLDVLIEMRDLFNRQMSLPGRTMDGWQPPYGSPEALERVALGRRVEVRLVLLEDQFASEARTRYLAGSQSVSVWSNGDIEGAIYEAKVLLRLMGEPGLDVERDMRFVPPPEE